MKVFHILLWLLVFFKTIPAIAKVPAEQDTIKIPGGIEHAGDFESTIMQDIDPNGARINPNRVYTLNEGQVYYQIGALKVDNPTGTLSITGVPSKYGNEKPIILIVPTHGMPVLSNEYMVVLSWLIYIINLRYLMELRTMNSFTVVQEISFRNL